MRETNPADVLQAFRRQYRTAGEAAKALGISLPYLSDMLHNRRDISPRMLAKLGLRRIVVREQKAS